MTKNHEDTQIITTTCVYCVAAGAAVTDNKLKFGYIAAESHFSNTKCCWISKPTEIIKSEDATNSWFNDSPSLQEVTDQEVLFFLFIHHLAILCRNVLNFLFKIWLKMVVIL